MWITFANGFKIIYGNLARQLWFITRMIWLNLQVFQVWIMRFFKVLLNGKVSFEGSGTRKIPEKSRIYEVKGNNWKLRVPDRTWWWLERPGGHRWLSRRPDRLRYRHFPSEGRAQRWERALWEHQRERAGRRKAVQHRQLCSWSRHPRTRTQEDSDSV